MPCEYSLRFVRQKRFVPRPVPGYSGIHRVSPDGWDPGSAWSSFFRCYLLGALYDGPSVKYKSIGVYGYRSGTPISRAHEILSHFINFEFNYHNIFLTVILILLFSYTHKLTDYLPNI